MIKKLLFALAGTVVPGFAHAHVKWFSRIADCRSAPLTPFDILSSPFFLMAGLIALVAMLIAAHIDWRLSRGDNIVVRIAGQLEYRTAKFVAPLLRACLAIYFFSIALYFHAIPIILTPELMTTALWVPVLQLVISVTVLSRRTSIVAAIGIAVLYAYGVTEYGVFHMLDYVFFPGVVFFLSIEWFNKKNQYSLGLAVLRISMGFSLLWAGLEKWAYPNWSINLLANDLSGVSMGLHPVFFVMEAGFIEFSLAFVMIFGRLASQIAAVVLVVVLISAMPLVGAIDVIGHIVMIAILLILTVTRNVIGFHPQRPGRPWNNLDQAISFIAIVPGAIGAYYLSHELAYTSLNRMNATALVLAVFLIVPLVVRLMMTAPRIFQLRRRKHSSFQKKKVRVQGGSMRTSGIEIRKRTRSQSPYAIAGSH
jgi:uncharacterized membrane protein YphA (DoxX/SURF4 family)